LQEKDVEIMSLLGKIRGMEGDLENVKTKE
jgi:hypothetical protein